jgi:hypothetical protein
MKNLLNKLNYKGQNRIAVINAEEDFFKAVSRELKNVYTDSMIDQRCPYGYMIFFVRSPEEVEQYAPLALHNLTADGILWFCYPKKTSKKYVSELDRDHGWKTLNDSGFFGIRMVAIDDDWSAMRFRDARFIKSASGKYVVERKC